MIGIWWVGELGWSYIFFLLFFRAFFLFFSLLLSLSFPLEFDSCSCLPGIKSLVYSGLCLVQPSLGNCNAWLFYSIVHQRAQEIGGWGRSRFGVLVLSTEAQIIKPCTVGNSLL